MIAARHIVRSLSEFGSRDLREAARLTAAGANPHRMAARFHLTLDQARSLPTLADAIRAVDADAARRGQR